MASKHPLEGCCISCGFLAQRAQWGQGPVRGYLEVEGEVRDNPGQAVHIFVPTVPLRQFEADLVCYRRASVFPQEQVNNASLRADPARAREVLAAERSCDWWMEYEPGLNPHEHHMELNARQLEKDRREFQLRMVDLENRLRGHSDRVIRRLTWLAIGVAAIIGIIQILVSTTPDSLVYKLLLGAKNMAPPK